MCNSSISQFNYSCWKAGYQKNICTKRSNYQRGMKMKDADKTKGKLIHELVELRKQLAELKDSESKSSMELSKSEARYRQLVENPLVGVWQADK